MWRVRHVQILIALSLGGLLLAAGCSGPAEKSPAGPDAPAAGSTTQAGEPLTPTGATDEPDDVEGADDADLEAVGEMPGDDPADLAAVTNPWLRLRHVAPWKGDLDGMVERGVIRLLVVHSRSWFFLDGARQRGLAVEFAKAFEAFLNERLELKGQGVQVLLIPVRRDELLPSLVEGLGDIAGGNLTITPQRRQLVDFTIPRIRDVKELVVTGPSVAPIESIDALAAREVWVRESSSYYESLLRINDALAARRLPGVRIRKADENLEDEDILEMVHSGLLSATVVDSHKLDWLWADIFDRITVNRDTAIREGGAIGTAVRKNSPQLLEVLNEFIAGHGAGTAFGDRVIKRHFSKRQWLRDLSKTSEMRKFHAVEDLFKRYASKYEFDHLMLMAQGYQESLLNQEARSHAGAVGVMQLLPSTAEHYPVKIPNVDELEPNIHAGIKYMRFIVDKHLDDPAIDPINKLLFAFASYNAGPNRIDRIRRQAAKQGFDPNQWFREVELAVAARVGSEPVQYVRNIYKYYLAYVEIRSREAQRQKALE